MREKIRHGFILKGDVDENHPKEVENMKMSHFIARRLFYSIFVLLGLSIVIFTMSRIFPGDPARTALGTLAPQWAVDNLREQLHLNDPIYVQYWIWLTNALHGDLGMSLVTKRPVNTDLATFFPATFELVIFSIIISITISVVVGVTAGRRANSLFDNIVRVVSYLGIAMPSFVWAIIAMFLFGYLWKILPALGRLSMGTVHPPRITGMLTIDSLITGNFAAFFDALKHMILPGSALAVGRLAQDTRLMRSSIVENLRKDYIAAAMSYGIPERTVMFKYLMKPSLIPVVSIMGLEISGAMAGSFIIEFIFNWPGFGRYGANAMLNKDLNAIIGSVMVVGVFFALINIAVDVIIAYLDPRIRMAVRSE
jgi:peptide/nickel transport system permease protein